MDEANTDLLAMTADIVSAHVSNNSVSTADLPGLITAIHSALTALGQPVEAEAVKAEPAVPIRSSVKNDYIVCLEDGKKLKMLKRYLRTNYDMTPEQYRAKWSLPRDYPMVAPAYAEQRRGLAKEIGLGRKKAEPVAAAPAASKAAKGAAKTAAAKPAAKRGRPAKVAAPVEA